MKNEKQTTAVPTYSSIKIDIERAFGHEKIKSADEQKQIVSLKLELYRAQHKLTVEALAKLIGVSKQQLIRWRKAEYLPDPYRMKRLEELKIV